MMHNAFRKIEPINKLLEANHGIRIEEAPKEHLIMVLEHYTAKRNAFINTLGYAPNNKEYQKVYLITEAIRIILREIAPKRQKGKRK